MLPVLHLFLLFFSLKFCEYCKIHTIGRMVVTKYYELYL